MVKGCGILLVVILLRKFLLFPPRSERGIINVIASPSWTLHLSVTSFVSRQASARLYHHS